MRYYRTKQPQARAIPAATIDPMAWLALLGAITLLLLARPAWAEGEAGTKPDRGVNIYEGNTNAAALEDRLRKAYDEFQKKQAQNQAQSAVNTGQGGGQGQGQGQAQQGKNGKPDPDADYKDKIKANEAYIKEMFMKAEGLFKEENYRESASFYASVVMANVPKTEKLVEDSRKRFIEMEGLAEQHLKNADDADLQRDFIKEVEELAIVVKQFPFTKAFDTAQRRLVNLKTRPDVAAYVEYAQAEAAESAGNLLQALKLYKAIADNTRWDSTVAQMKAKRKLATLEKNEAAKEQVKAELQAQADKECPKLLAAAKNFISNNMPAQAKEKLRTVTEKYPGTKYADDAQQQLNDMP